MRPATGLQRRDVGAPRDPSLCRRRSARAGVAAAAAATPLAALPPPPPARGPAGRAVIIAAALCTTASCPTPAEVRRARRARCARARATIAWREPAREQTHPSPDADDERACWLPGAPTPSSVSSCRVSVDVAFQYRRHRSLSAGDSRRERRGFRFRRSAGRSARACAAPRSDPRRRWLAVSPRTRDLALVARRWMKTGVLSWTKTRATTIPDRRRNKADGRCGRLHDDDEDPMNAASVWGCAGRRAVRARAARRARGSRRRA